MSNVSTAPGALPVIGHIAKLMRDPLAFFRGQLDNGAVVKFRLGPREAYLVNQPSLVYGLLVDPDHQFDKGGVFFESARALVGNGLITCSSAEHRRQRALMQPAFHRDQLKAYASVMRATTVEVIDGWRDGDVINVHRELLNLAALMATRTLITAPTGGRQAAAMAEAMPALLPGLHRRMVVPMEAAHRIPTPANRRFDQALNKFRTAVDEILAQYRAEDTDRGDLLTRIMTAQDEESGSPLSDEEIHDQVISIMAASIETTASLLAWTFHSLSGHPDVERKLWDELDSVLGDRDPEHDDLAGLPYARRVLTETLRVYPPAWTLTRITKTEVNLDGNRIPAGADVFISPYAVHRAPEVYADPDRFDPDRWLPERVTSAQRQGFIALGAGRRKCIGDAFAMIEAGIVLAAVARRWQLRPADGQRVRPVARMMLNPSSLNMVLKGR